MARCLELDAVIPWLELLKGILPFAVGLCRGRFLPGRPKLAVNNDTCPLDR